MKFKNKTELEEYIKIHTIPFNLELKESSLGGLGLFAKDNLPSGTIFPLIYLGKGYDSIPELRRYIWWNDGTIYGGVGYYCNGSCYQFEVLLNDGIEKLGPYILTEYNIVLYDRKYFKTIKDIRRGEELILDYGDRYFFDYNSTGIDYNKLITDGEGNFIDVGKYINFSTRLNKVFSK